MARIEAIAIVRKVDRSWIAAIAFIGTGSSTMDVTSASTEGIARRWIIEKAGIAGLSETAVQFIED